MDFRNLSFPEVPYAYCYRCAFGKKPETCEFDCAQYLEHILEDPHSGVGKPREVIVMD